MQIWQANSPTSKLGMRRCLLPSRRMQTGWRQSRMPRIARITMRRRHNPQWQIEALWRSQIPEEIADRWNYPSLTPRAKRLILGLNSARLYGLPPAAIRYGDGALPTYPADPALQLNGQMDTILRGVGYPEPVVSASLMPQDRIAKAKQWLDDIGAGRSNTRFGWMRTRV